MLERFIKLSLCDEGRHTVIQGLNEVEIIGLLTTALINANQRILLKRKENDGDNSESNDVLM